jgi:hypothetical protein
MPEPHLRAGDADRAAVASVLGQAMAAGRLTVDEYDERLTRVFAAKTYGDLAELTADLPGQQPRRAVTPSPSGAPAFRHGCGGARSPWAAWRSVAVIVLGIWLATSLAANVLLPFWPMWVLLPWGAVLLASSFGGGPRHRRRLPR